MTASVKHRKRPPTSVSPQGDTKHQAEYLSHTRREHANEVAEDHVEAIADLVSTSSIQSRAFILQARTEHPSAKRFSSTPF